jgi:hypothetical protein
MSTSKRNKIKGMFSRDQKENIITQDGKRNLYFDRERENFIKFGLVVGTTCSYILKNYKEDIINKLKEINGQEEVNLNNYSFFIVELIANKYERKQTLIDLKIDMEDISLFNILQNRQLILCFLPVKKSDISLRKKFRNELEISNIPDNLILEAEVNNVKNKDKNEIITYLDKTVIHYYNEKNSFSKEKIKVTEKEITIFYGKEQKNTSIKDIKSKKLITSNDEKQIQNFFKGYAINGYKPKFCIEIISGNEQKLLIGRNTLQHFETLVKAIDIACVNFRNYFVDNFINMETTKETNGILYTSNCISQSFTINDLLINKEKRKILLEDFSEIYLKDIVNNIMDYKIYFKKKKYSKAISRIKNILEIINEKMTKEELDKYQKIINKERIEQIEDINKKIKEICGEDKNIDETNIIELQKIININMFDYLYLEIKDEYLSKYYEENNYVIKKNNDSSISNNFKIIQNTKLLLGHYFTNIFNINKEKDVLLLGGPEVEETAKDYNDKLFQAKMNKHYVI